MVGRRLDRGASRARAARRAALDLRSARAVVAEGARLARARRAVGDLRERPRFHARRTAARDAPPVLRVVGLPGDGVLRASLDDGIARRFPLVRRPPALAGDRCDPRLGACALPARRMGPRAVRRLGAVRARGPATRLAPGLGDADLQPRAHRGAELLARERALLAALLPRRRAARGRGRLDALPRLLAEGRGVGAECVRRPRGSRRRRIPEGDERARSRARAWHHLGRRGVDGLARRVEADLRRGARFRASNGTWGG